MPQKYYPPPESKGGWRTITSKPDIQGLGLDPESLDAFAEWNMRNQNTFPAAASQISVLVLKDGWLVKEAYDRPETKVQPVWTASIGKSMSACMVGRWMERGASGCSYPLVLESPVYNPMYLPEGYPLSDSRKEGITLYQLLNHTSGMKPSPEFFQGENFSFLDYTLGHSELYPDSQELTFDPGNGYGYSNIAYNHLALMSPHLTRLLLHEAMEQEIFTPIGVGCTAWYRGGSAYTHNGKTYQPSCAGPDMTARDLARFAYLLLREGAWEQGSLIPVWFLNEMKLVRRTNESQPGDSGLGLHTNVNGGVSSILPKDTFALRGSGLNVILIIPSADMILLRASQVNTINGKRFFREFVGKAEELFS